MQQRHDLVAKSSDMRGGSDPALDLSLLHKSATGDEISFGRLVERHERRLRAVARQFLNDAEADEVVQEAFISLWSSAGRFDGQRGSVGTWLYRVVANRCIDRQRSRWRWLTTPLGTMDWASAEPLADRVVAGQQEIASLGRDLASLPERQRLALLLATVGERSVGEIAEIIGSSKAATEQLIVRARRTLRNRMRERTDGP